MENIKIFEIYKESFWYNINSEFKETGGVYKLFCVDHNEQRIEVNRVLKNDSNGILYIGKATSFLDRVITLKKALSPEHKSENHECGVRYKKHFKEKFPYDKLRLELIESGDIGYLERELLSDYEKEFGELPPLNRMK